MLKNIGCRTCDYGGTETITGPEMDVHFLFTDILKKYFYTNTLTSRMNCVLRHYFLSHNVNNFLFPLKKKKKPSVK
uniref:Uncharacterized protein n=1 Tax=Sus scrofa TaxID=9823 RepID=A0A4X1VLM5_PIG